MIAFTTTRPNAPVRIYNGPFEIHKDGKPITIESSITIDWFPRPRLLFRATIPIEAFEGLLKHSSIVDTDGAFLCERGGGMAVEIYEDGSVDVEHELVTFEKKCTSNLDRVFFHVVNLDQIQTLDEPPAVEAPSVTNNVTDFGLRGGGWHVKVTALETQDLGKRGGFALTHFGELVREDQKAFSQTDAKNLLESLRYFLSFVRGGWCWPCLFLGMMRSECCWLSCDQPPEIDHIGTVPNNFPFPAQQDIDAIKASFAGYLQLWSDPAWQKPIQTALSWFVESSHTRSMETSIVAGQTALELIAWLKVVENAKALSAEGFDRLSASDRFKLLLNLQRIPAVFPSYASELREHSAKQGWEDGPRAIAELRNSIVHLKKREKLYRASEEVRRQARNLTLWILASAILRLFGYTGDLSDRLRPES